MTAEAALRHSAPPWAYLFAVKAEQISWIAAPPLPSGSPTPATLVRTTVEAGLVFASECQPGTRLPKRCPELHVNGDATFCLGRRVYQVDDETALAAFWQDLGEYLVNQHHAIRRGRWPAGRWLSHGPVAADRQADAEGAAAKIGIGSEYDACIEADEGWVAKLVRGKTKRIPRGQPCPRGCRDGDGRAIPFRSCRHAAVLQRIVTAETARRAAHDDYFRALRRSGAKCCGRVANCPLHAGRIAA